MKKIIYFSIVLLSTILFSCGNDKESANDTKAFTQEQIVTESKKANDFFDRVYDEAIDRDPQSQSRLGIKKDYDKWTDISDEHTKKEIEIVKQNIDSLHQLIKYDALDDQAKISYRLFEVQSNERIDNFKWRFHDYPVNQMGGMHAEVPAFLFAIV